jgi:hypothetical protein
MEPKQGLVHALDRLGCFKSSQDLTDSPIRRNMSTGNLLPSSSSKNVRSPLWRNVSIIAAQALFGKWKTSI